MKKIIILVLALSPMIYSTSCKKEYSTDSVTQKIVEPHYPEITLSSPQYLSINTGGSLPTITATAYDSTVMEVCEMFPVDASGLDNTTPGLYPVSVKARNTDGYITTKNVYVAVTDITPAMNLGGLYQRTATGVDVMVTEVDNGLYSIDNFFGAATTPDTYAYFVQIDDSTIVMPTQETTEGLLKSSDHFLSLLPSDTTFGYKLKSITSNDVLRTFKKQ